MKRKVLMILGTLFELTLVTLFIMYVFPSKTNKHDKSLVYVENTAFTKNADVNSEIFIKDEISEEEKIETPVEEKKVEAPVTPKQEVTVPKKTEVDSLNTFYGNLTGYGADCYGCSGYTAVENYNVWNTIYYTDKTFGGVRIVAADRSIPDYSIIRITIEGRDPIIAIVLDRGGGVGFGKHSTVDILEESEYAAGINIGTIYNTKFEILRYGG